MGALKASRVQATTTLRSVLLSHWRHCNRHTVLTFQGGGADERKGGMTDVYHFK